MSLALSVNSTGNTVIVRLAGTAVGSMVRNRVDAEIGVILISALLEMPLSTHLRLSEHLVANAYVPEGGCYLASQLELAWARLNQPSARNGFSRDAREIPNVSSVGLSEWLSTIGK